MEKNKFYVTTSIAYTNAYPHIGFALESVQADVVARYSRLLGDDVFFLTGTDEHGQKICRTAAKENKNPKEFVDDISEKYRLLTEKLNLSNNDFIRTTDQIRHWPIVQKVWLKLKENGDIYKKEYHGFYCVGCEAFITQKDLVRGKCRIHQKEPEAIEEENYFFKLSKYSQKIEEIIKGDKVRIIPMERKKEMLNFISQGLDDVSFSRPSKDLSWGVPVPDDDTQTIYVWADALVNYISALDYPAGENFKKYWPADIHFLGKDILRFHSTIWLGMLLALELDLPRSIFVHGFITSGGQKMSKSLGNVVDPFGLIQKYGVDTLRYYLLKEIPSTEDGDFTAEKFAERYNADLAGGLGNLVARVITVADKNNITANKEKLSSAFEEEIEKVRRNLDEIMASFKFNDAINLIWGLISYCDEYIEKERPWEEKENQNVAINNLLVAISEIAGFLEPFLPETAQKISKQLKDKKSEPLFPRII